jgi:RHS repeat-associated protein
MKAIRISLTALLSIFALAATALADPPHGGKMTSNSSEVWTSGMYVYDGAGNITGIGADWYTYDLVGRLLTGTTDRQRTGNLNQQVFTYDAFGNRKTVTKTGGGCLNNVDCYQDVGINSATNRINTNSVVYDAAGNVTTIDGASFKYEYDGAGMMSYESTPGAEMEFIFTPDDERIATYQGGGWTFTPRDLSGKVLREVTAVQTGSTFDSWAWQKDHIWRDGILLASSTPAGTEHFHIDHLGTPRLVTNDGGETIGVHSYYPFGAELVVTPAESPVEALKFTGHERDTLTGLGAAHTLDYMHARFGSAMLGRFMSVDPVLASAASVRQPQRWNRYVYTANNPIKFVDPSGERIQLMGTKQQREDEMAALLTSMDSAAASYFITMTTANGEEFVVMAGGMTANDLAPGEPASTVEMAISSGATIQFFLGRNEFTDAHDGAYTAQVNAQGKEDGKSSNSLISIDPARIPDSANGVPETLSSIIQHELGHALGIAQGTYKDRRLSARFPAGGTNPDAIYAENKARAWYRENIKSRHIFEPYEDLMMSFWRDRPSH